MKQFAAGLTVALLATAVIAADPAVKSGPQVNEKLAGPFHPLNITGAKAGEKNCLYCENGNNPVAMIFARETSPALTKLIKRIDETTMKNKGAEMGSFVVFCSDKDGLDKELAAMAKDTGIKSTVLAIDNPAGPKGYNVARTLTLPSCSTPSALRRSTTPSRRVSSPTRTSTPSSPTSPRFCRASKVRSGAPTS